MGRVDVYTRPVARTGTKLEALYSAYTTTVPPVHTKIMGKILFAKMLNAVFPQHRPAQELHSHRQRNLPTPLKGGEKSCVHRHNEKHRI